MRKANITRMHRTDGHVIREERRARRSFRHRSWVWFLKRSASIWTAAFLLAGCGGQVERDWTASSYREQFPGTAPGCLTACVISGQGCAMAGPNGEHERCASGNDPVMLQTSELGTCVVEAKPCAFACRVDCVRFRGGSRLCVQLDSPEDLADESFWGKVEAVESSHSCPGLPGENALVGNGM